MNFAVVLPQFPWSRCLDDLRDNLVEALRAAGNRVAPLNTFQRHEAGGKTEWIPVLLGAHSGSVTLPDYPVVIYQTELPGTTWFTPNYKERLAKALAVWQADTSFCRGLPSEVAVEPGLHVTQAATVPKDIDLLFYGSLSERRVAILQKLSDAGLKVEAHFGVFGAERNALIDRAKVVVDIKQRDGDPNDKTRTFFLDSRGACVLSENDDKAERALDPRVIVEQCRYLLSNAENRHAHAASRRSDLRATDVGPAVRLVEKLLAAKVTGSNGAAHHHV